MSKFKFEKLSVAVLVALASASAMSATPGTETGNASVAIGNRSTASGNFSVALGSEAEAIMQGGVALGASSVADRDRYVTGFSFTTGAKSGRNWYSNSAAISVGSSVQYTRQIINVAAGSEDSDAVNLAQLKDLRDYTVANTVFGQNTSIEIPAVLGGEDGTTELEPARNALNASVLGNNAKVQADGAVAIGANSIAQSRVVETTDEAGITTRTAPIGYGIDPSAITDENRAVWQGDAKHGVVSFGGTYQPVDDQGQPTGEPVAFNRQLTGVAAGSEDNDAVNVAQLKQLESNTATQLNDLMEGKTQVSEIQLLAKNENGDPITDASGKSATIGLRYQVAAAETAALADGDSGVATQSQGRLIYNNLDATGRVIGTETVATLNDGIKISAGSSSSAAREGEAAPVKVDLNKGISFLTDSDYLSANVASDNNGGAVVTFSTTQALADALKNAGGSTGGNTGGDSGSSGNTGGSGWTPSQAQLAAMNGNFANGITVTPGEGNQAIQIKQGNVDMGGNRIQNVGNPINDGDAANKAYVDSTSRSLRNKINDVDKDLRAGVAMAMAVGNLPQAYMPGKSILAMSAGTYHGQGGFALGLSHATDNRQWVFKGAASVDTRGNFGGTLSAGYQF